MTGDERPDVDPPPGGDSEELWRTITSGTSGSDGAQSWSHSGLILGLEADSASEPSVIDDSDAISITTSLATSSYEHRYENGRRFHQYHDEGYSLPNDEQEAERLELQHLIWSKLLNGRILLAPLKNNMTDAIDIGCGTGAWVMEFAAMYPGTAVVGMDLSPIQPEFVPPNVSWLIDNANNPWPVDFAGKFDYVHTRLVGMGIANWTNFFRSAWDALKPGGWLELQEFTLPLGCDDGSFKGTYVEEWSDRMTRGAAKFGIDTLAGHKHTERMREQGFVRVQNVKLKAPIGPWAKGRVEKDLGVMGLKDVCENLPGISTKLFMTELSKEEVESLLAKVQRDMMNPRIHTYMPFTISWAQKPLTAVASDRTE